MTTDPIADMLTRLRNALMARHDSLTMPASKLKEQLARILKEEGYISNYELVRDGGHPSIRIHLRYVGKGEPVVSGVKRVSKPGLRVYVQRREIPRVHGGLGVAIMSTPQGIMTGRQAWQRGLGGELLCFVW